MLTHSCTSVHTSSNGTAVIQVRILCLDTCMFMRCQKIDIYMYCTIHGYDCPSLSENKCMSFFDILVVHNFIFKKNPQTILKCN